SYTESPDLLSCFFFSSRRRHTRWPRDWSSDVCSSDLDSLTCYTDDDGTTWSPSQGGGVPSGVDHQTLGGGNYVASDPLNATNTYNRAVYYCSQDIATAFCALSRTGGVIFGAGVPTYNL